MCLCVSSDQYIPVLLDFVVLGLVYFLPYKANRLAGKNVSEMTYSVSSGT